MRFNPPSDGGSAASPAAPILLQMGKLTVECLCCGQRRVIAKGGLRVVGDGECPRCGYLGWALTSDLNERVRGMLRSRPPARRRLNAI